MKEQKYENKNSTKIISVDEKAVKEKPNEMVRDTVEETLNMLLDQEAERLCNAKKYERKEDRRAGYYQRSLETKAGKVRLNVPKLRTLRFESAIIERYRRRESSVEEALIEMYLAGVELFISYKCIGLIEALGEYYPEARWQGCIVHFYRNVFMYVPRGKLKEVAAMLKAIHAQEEREEAMRKAESVVKKLKDMKLRRAAKVVEDGILETLSYTYFPREHWRRIRTNNPLERTMREVRRHTRVVGAVPDGESGWW